eukprot:916922_1
MMIQIQWCPCTNVYSKLMSLQWIRTMYLVALQSNEYPFSLVHSDNSTSKTMEAMLLKKKKTLKKKEMMPQPGPDEAAIRDDDPFQGLQPDLNLNQVPKNDSRESDQQRALKYTRSNREIGDTQVSMRNKSVAKWIRQQEKAFTGWVNAHLQTRSMHIDSLQKDIPHVAPLIHLLEILEKKPLREITKYHKKPRHKFDLLDGLRICLKQIRSRGRKDIKVGFDAEILLRGDQKKQYLALIWRIIVNYAIEDTTAEEVLDNKKRKFKTPEARLRWWCNKRLTEELQIKNFTKDWSDGKVLVCLMNQALDENDRICEEDLEDMDTEELLEGLLKLGDKHLHIPQLLDPSDLMYSPNKEAVMTYVSLLRTAIDQYQSIVISRVFNCYLQLNIIQTPHPQQLHHIQCNKTSDATYNGHCHSHNRALITK